MGVHLARGKNFGFMAAVLQPEQLFHYTGTFLQLWITLKKLFYIILKQII